MTGKFKKSLVVGGLLAIFFIQAVASMVQKSPTADEAAHHIAPGYSFLKTRDFRLNSTAPPLIEELCAIPLLFMKDLKLPLDHPSWKNIARAEFSEQFLYYYNKNTDQIVFWSRIPCVLMGVLLGFLVYFWANKLYGFRSGILALFLYSFSPSILAHTRLVTADIGASCFIFMATLSFYMYCKNPSFKILVFSGVTFGLAQLTKYTAVYLYPLYFVFFLLIWFFSKKDFMVDYIVSRNIRKFFFSIIFIILIGNLVVFCGYLFEVKPLLLNDIDVGEKIAYFEAFITKVFGENREWVKDGFINFALNQPVPFSTYIMSFLGASNQTFVEHKFAPMLFGTEFSGSLWYYYIIVFGLKTSLPVLLFLALVIILFKRFRGKVFDELFLLIPVVILMVFASISILQSGQRYILPIYPFLFVFIGKLLTVREKVQKDSCQQKWFYALVFILAFSHLAASARIFPHYLAYYNTLVGGPDKSYKCLTHTNTDIGQDLKGLAEYLKKNNIRDVKLCYNGSIPPEVYGIEYLDIDEEELLSPKKYVYAVSVQRAAELKWTEIYEPKHKIGYSIFIYDFRYY